VNWLKRLFGKKTVEKSEPTRVEPVQTKPVEPAQVAGAPKTDPEPVLLAEPPADAVAVAYVPDVAVLLKRVDERRAFEKAFLDEGLSVEAPETPDLSDVTDYGLAKLVVVDDRKRFDELLGKPVDVILVTDEDVEDGPMGEHAYVTHRPLDLTNPLGKQP